MILPFDIKPQRPSKYLEQFGDIVPHSFYECSQENGTLIIREEYVFQCNFEIAYMQSGVIFAVMYTLPSNIEKSLRQILFELPAGSNITFEGSDHQNNVSIQGQVNRILDYESLMTSSPPRSYRIACLISRFEVQAEAKTQDDVAIFSIRNLPLHEFYSYEWWERVYQNNREEFYQNVAVDAAIKAILENHSEEGIKKEKLLQIGQDAAIETTTDEYRKQLAEKPVSPKDSFPIIINDELVAEILWIRSYRKREYDTQPLAKLRLYSQKLPETWEREEFAHWVCHLLSIALGREITWNNYSLFAKELKPSEDPLSVQIWRSQTITTNTFLAFTEYDGSFYPNSGLTEDSNPFDFVHDAIHHLSSTTREVREQYLKIVSYYILHSATDSILETRMAMLCMLGERIYSIWTKTSGSKVPKRFTRGQANDIRVKLESQLREELATISEKSDSETGEEFEVRLDELTNKIISPLSRSLRSASLRDKYHWLFKQYGWQLDTPFRRFTNDKSFREYIKQFVKSRDSLAHNHKFATIKKNGQSEDEYQKLLRMEIENIQMFIPTLLATILGYKGKFWTYYSEIKHPSGIWHYMPEHERGHKSIKLSK